MPETTTCACISHKATNHDELLNIEAAGFADFVDLVLEVITWDDIDYGNHVHPVDFKDFAAEHSWENPVKALRLFGALSEIYRNYWEHRAQAELISHVRDLLPDAIVGPARRLRPVARG